MTTGLEAIYIVLMAVGLLWVISKTISYVRKQRQMEARWNDMIYDEGFKDYLDKLKEQASDVNETDSGDKPAPGGAAH
jgi:hypothetical protein